jgi:hypothetical protein
MKGPIKGETAGGMKEGEEVVEENVELVEGREAKRCTVGRGRCIPVGGHKEEEGGGEEG